MTLWKIRNLTASSLTVEDLGIALQASGGADDSATVTEHSHAHSRSLRNLESRRLVSVTPIREAPMPVWPVSKPKDLSSDVPPQEVAPVSIPVPAPAPISCPDPVVPSTEVAELRASIDSLRAVIERLVAAPGLPTMMYVPQGPPGSLPIPQSTVSSADPQFIPSRILPVGADAQIHAKKEESDGSSVDESAGALKNLRKKAPNR